MKPDKIKYYSENLERIAHKDRIFLNNPVVMQGLGLAPIIVASTSVKSAVILSCAVLLLLMPTRVMAAVLSKNSYFRFRGFTYALTASIVYIGVFWVLNQAFPAADIANVGIYLPMLVVEPIIIKRYERPMKEHISTAFRKGIITSIGFVIVIILVGFLRELLGSGTIWSVPVGKFALVPLLKLPAGGFMILAIIIAVWRAFVNKFKRKINMEAKRTNA